jgi:hypothetical protein
MTRGETVVSTWGMRGHFGAGGWSAGANTTAVGGRGEAAYRRTDVGGRGNRWRGWFGRMGGALIRCLLQEGLPYFDRVSTLNPAGWALFNANTAYRRAFAPAFLNSVWTMIAVVALNQRVL